MSVVSRTGRLYVVLTTIAMLNGAAAWPAVSALAADDAAAHCRAMRAMHAGMQHCRQAAMMTCCTDDRQQPQSTLPTVPASDGIGSARAPHAASIAAAGMAPPLHVGSAWYARPPTHGYSSQSLLVLQSVLLI